MLRQFCFVALIVLLIAKVVGVIAQGPSPVVMDAAGYWSLGETARQGDWLLLREPIAYRTPGYPWLIAVTRAVLPDPLFWLTCLQGAMWLATVLITGLLAGSLAQDRRAAWFVLIGATLMISSVVYVTTVLTETLFVFLLMAHLASVVRLGRSPTIAGGVLAGLTLGLTILTRPIAMLLWIPDLIYLVVHWQTRWSVDRPAPRGLHRRVSVAVAALLTIGCLTPWLTRNRALFGEAMITEFVGRNLWIVTFQDGSGAGLSLPDSAPANELQRQIGAATWRDLQTDQRWRHTWTISDSLVRSGLSDPAADRLMKQVAVDAALQSPKVFMAKAIRRCVNFWRTRATELPVQFAQLAPDDARSGEQLRRELYAGEAVWGTPLAPIQTWIRYRYSNWLTGNTLLMIVTGLATVVMIYRKSTRAGGIWVAAVFGYFSLVTGILEIPAYRYRMIVEPMVLLVISVSASLLLPGSSAPTDQTQ
ncbi:glycosyltransferase family 39 protein [Roseiconus nitratireducens]|uniref:Glycosyltransferase family 39 protein n=1 Tax=Roseiconus nitratireducens TaxID=2605748 RepID=A0A5M6DAE9_9BACT|nr:glycosyltransferase family 39 protein [Roseiconus nitratireducens]KAA5544527.1 glycosyltransferase family 39 protein [Roseiconus nitratireducens]